MLWAMSMPRGLVVMGLVVLLAATWALVYVTGGTRTALPHLFYIPILLAVLRLRMTGGVAVAVAAALACGPLMPLDVTAGTAQPLGNWLVRGLFFVTIGVLAGAMVGWLRSAYGQGVAELIRQDVMAGRPGGDVADPAVETQIRQVLADRRFHPVFQPIYSLDLGHLVAVEALTRFDDEPNRPPDVWFTLAAQIGLGADLELAAMTEALAATVDLPAGVTVTLNSSPATLADPRLLELVDRYRNRPLIVEVTEHAVVDDYQLLDDARAELRRRGVKLAVDDAGAGFASLRHIVRLAPEYIKLDSSLTRDILFDPVRQALAKSLIHFAQQTGSLLIAEGIEQTSDLLAWRDLGAFAAQGYLLAPPGPLPVADRFDLASIRSWNKLNLPRAANASSNLQEPRRTALAHPR